MTARRQYDDSVTEAQTWHTRAVKMLRHEASALLKPAELAVFIKRGETLLVLGEGLCECSIATTTMTKSSSSDNDDHMKIENESIAIAASTSSMSSTSNNIYRLKSSIDAVSINTAISSSLAPVLTPGFFNQIVKLKADLKSSKLLTNKIQSLNEAETQSTNISVEMDSLLTEADTLAVDMAEATESIKQVIKCYCFCRLGYHGEMIGCDKCNDWYHLSCICMSQQAAEKTDTYVCIRCQIQTSFLDTCRKVAQITNKWMKPMELAKQRDMKKSKVIHVYAYVCVFTYVCVIECIYYIFTFLVVWYNVSYL